jgi:hypothetical protein
MTATISCYYLSFDTIDVRKGYMEEPALLHYTENQGVKLSVYAGGIGTVQDSVQIYDFPFRGSLH